MRVVAAGVNSAFAIGEKVQVVGTDDTTENLYRPRFQSNFILRFSPPSTGYARSFRDSHEKSLILNSEKRASNQLSEDFFFGFDFGSDIRHSLFMNADMKVHQVDAWYCSHPHADHVGGLENIALLTFFNPFYNTKKLQEIQSVASDSNDVLKYMHAKRQGLPAHCKPMLLAHEDVMPEIWELGAPGLKTLQGVPDTCLDTYFDLNKISSNVPFYILDGDRYWTVYTIQSTHVIGGTAQMKCYGLFFESDDNVKIYMPADTMLMMPPSMEVFYHRADVIFQDTETGFRSGVHSHIDDIEKIDPEIKKKLVLYHYNEEPHVNESDYYQVLRAGDVLTF